MTNINSFEVEGMGRLIFTQWALRDMRIYGPDPQTAINNLVALAKEDPLLAFYLLVKAGLVGQYFEDMDSPDHNWQPNLKKINQFIGKANVEQWNTVFNAFMEAMGVVPQQLADIAKRQQELSGNDEPAEPSKKKRGNQTLKKD